MKKKTSQFYYSMCAFCVLANNFIHSRYVMLLDARPGLCGWMCVPRFVVRSFGPFIRDAVCTVCTALKFNLCTYMNSIQHMHSGYHGFRFIFGSPTVNNVSCECGVYLIVQNVQFVSEGIIDRKTIFHAFV